MTHAPLLKRLVIISIGMFAFAFALVPLYDVFCDLTGLNGKPSLEQAQQSSVIEQTRDVSVSFTTHAQSGAPFEVKSKEYSVVVKPGEMREVVFSAKNSSELDKVMQAVRRGIPAKPTKCIGKNSTFTLTNDNQKCHLASVILNILPVHFGSQ